MSEGVITICQRVATAGNVACRGSDSLGNGTAEIDIRYDMVEKTPFYGVV